MDKIGKSKVIIIEFILQFPTIIAGFFLENNFFKSELMKFLVNS